MNNRRWVDFAVWIPITPFLAWALLRLAGWEPGRYWIMLASFTPYAVLSAIVAPLPALILKRWWALGAGLLAALALAGMVVPRVIPDDNPAADGPAIRILSANLRWGSVPPGDVVDLLRRKRVDVLTLQEHTPASSTGLHAAGLARLLPSRVDLAAEGAHGSAVYSRYPVRAGQPVGRTRSSRAQVSVPGTAPIDVVAAHPCAPATPAGARCWSADLRALPAASPRGAVRILAGDFNATLDHPPLRRLIGTGYRDAAEVTGKGLSMTWPYRGGQLTPPVAIDHILADKRVAIRGFSTHNLPDSDHRAVYAELTLPR